jgi:signal transduction histidine kinase
MFGDQHLNGYAHVANQLREQVSYRSLSVLISGWGDEQARVAYRASTDIPATGPSWTASELNSFVTNRTVSSSLTIVESSNALWSIAPLGELRPPIAHLLIERPPGTPFSETELQCLRTAALSMTAVIVEAELRSARETLLLERKITLELSEHVAEAGESRGWQESAHQELQQAFDALSEQKLELEEAYRWSSAARDEIQSSFDDLTIANGAKTRFLATVSHELKTPLTSISAFTDILKKNRSGNLNQRELKQLNVISRNVHRLNLLINDLLDLTRIDAGTLTLESGDFRISDLLRDMSAMFEPILNKRNQRLDVRDSSAGLWITGDRNRMEQMVTNLVTNASKFSPEGTVISMKAEIKGEQLELTISDNGVGIPVESQAKIFEAFYRVDNEETRSVPGTGVGLYITASIVNLHGGEISVESQPGKGTTIRTTLPGLIDGPSNEFLKREATRLEAIEDRRSRLEIEHRKAA